MSKLLIAVLLLAASPVAAQVGTANDQLLTGAQGGQFAPTQAPTTGVSCIEEMTATFCNVVTGPNTNGYGGSGSSGGAGSNTPTPSIPVCAAEWPANEPCN